MQGILLILIEFYPLITKLTAVHGHYPPHEKNCKFSTLAVFLTYLVLVFDL